MSDTALKIKIAIDAQTEKIDEVRGALGRLGNSVDIAGKKVSDVDVAISTFAKGFVISKVIDGLAAVGASTSAALGSVDEFEHKMAEVSTLSGATAEQIKKLSVGVANLSVPFSNLQIGEALYQAQSAGVGFGQSLQFVEKSSKLAVAGNADLRASTDLLTNVMNSYSLSADQAGRVSDAAMAAVKGGKTTIREMGADIGKLAAGFASAGISMEDMFAMMATVTSGGIGTAETITYLSAAIQNITKPSEEAKKVAKQLGIEFNFQGLQAKGAIEFFRELSEKTKEYSNQAEIITQLFGSEASRGVNQMLRGNAEALEKMAEAQRDNSGATDEAADKMDTAKNAGLELQKSLEGIAFALKDGFDQSSAVKAIAEALSNGEKVVSSVGSAFTIAAAGAGTFGTALAAMKAVEFAKDLTSAANATKFVSNGLGGMSTAANTATVITGKLGAEYEADLKKFGSVKAKKEEIEKNYVKKLAALNKVTLSKSLDEEIKQEADAYAAKENFQTSIEQGLLSEAATIKKVYEYRKSAIELSASGVEKERKLEELRHEEAIFNLKEELRQKKLDPNQYQTAMELENERYRQSANNLTGGVKQAFDTLQGALQSGFFDVMTGKFKNLGDTFRNIFLNAGNSVAQSLSKSMSESITDYAKQLITGQSPTTAEALLSPTASFGAIDPQNYGDIANMVGSTVDGAIITTKGGSIVDTATGMVRVQGSDVGSLPIAPSASGTKNQINNTLKLLDSAQTFATVGTKIMSAGTGMVNAMGTMGISSGGTLGTIAGNVQGFGYGMANPGISAGTGGATGAGAIAGQMAGGAAIGYAMGWAGDKIMGSQTQAANYAAIGGAIGSVVPVVGTVMGAAIGALIGGSMGTKKLDNAAIDIGHASAEAVAAQNRETYKTKSWFGVKTDVKTYDISDQQKTAIKKTFKAYDYLLAELGIMGKLAVNGGAYESVKDFLDKGITKAFIVATGAVDTETIYAAWTDYAKTINKTVAEAFGEQISIFVTEKRAFTEWNLGFSGNTIAALKYKTEYTTKDFTKLAESMGATGVTAENFADKMDKSVKASLTPENIKNWSSLSAAIKASEEAQKVYKNAIKETTKTVQSLIDSISNLSANTAVAYTMSARNLRSAKEEFATAFDVVAPEDIGNLREYMQNLDISSLTDSQASSLQTLTSAYTTIDQAQKAYTATLQQTANTVNGMVESVLYRNATPDTKLALAKVNYQVVWGEEANAGNTTEWYNLLKQKQVGLEEGTTFSDFQTKTLNDLGAALASVEDAAAQTATALAETAKAEIERRKSLIADIDAYIEQIGYRHATVEEKLALASVQFHASTGSISPVDIKGWMDYGEALKGANPTDTNVEAWKKLGQTLSDVQDMLLNKAKEVEAAWKSATTDIEAAIKALNPTIRSMSELQGQSVTLDNYKELLNALESSRQEELKRAQEATDARLKSLEDEKRLIIDIQRIVQTMTDRIIDVQVANNVNYKSELSKVTAAMQTSFNVDLTNVTSAANNYLNKYQEESTSRLDYIRQVASVRADFSSLTGQTHGTIESIERAIKDAQMALEYRLSEINNTAKSILHDWLIQAKAAQAEAANHTQMILSQIAAVQQEILNKNLSVTVNVNSAPVAGAVTGGGGGSGTVPPPTIIPTVTPVAPSVPTNEFYNAIDAAYRTVLGRGVTDNNDITGLPYWTNALESGSVSLADLVKSVAIGSVPEMYQDLQLSLASWAHDFWKNKVLAGGVAPQNLRANVSYIKQINEAYQAVLGRAPDQSGFAFWADALVRGEQNPSTLKSDLRLAAIAAGEPTLFADGGIVTKATNAIIGEAGYPEAVIPLKDGAGLKVDVSGVTVELRALRDEIRELKEVTIAVLEENQRLRSTIMQMSKNGSSLNVELQGAA